MRPTIGLSLPILVLALLMSGGAHAAGDELTVDPDRQISLTLTIYQQDLALVEDQRTVALTEGLNRIAFEGVSAQLRPETVVVGTGANEPVRLIEQRYQNNLVTPQSLLVASVGHQIRVAIQNPKTGDEKIEPATVLSATGGVVLKLGDRIETTAPGRLIFNSVPDNLRERPTLVLAFTGLKGGSAPLTLGYLSGGLGWSANYVAELNGSEDNLSLNGRASIANDSGATYRNAHLILVAGNPNRRAEEATRARLRVADGITPAPSSPEGAPQQAAPSPEAVSEFYRYSIDREIGLDEREAIQLALLEATAVPVKKEYSLNDSPPVTSQGGSEPTPLPVVARLNFDNKKSAGLGMPLPSGIVRVYQRDAAGASFFLGEDSLSNTAADKPVKLTLGQAFDVTAERRQTNARRPTDRSYEASEEIVLHNAKDKPVTVTVVENLSGDWRIIEESDKHEKATSSAAQWRVEVPAKGERKLTFQVESRF